MGSMGTHGGAGQLRLHLPPSFSYGNQSILAFHTDPQSRCKFSYVRPPSRLLPAFCFQAWNPSFCYGNPSILAFHTDPQSSCKFCYVRLADCCWL